jgi:DnaK suppressor protein
MSRRTKPKSSAKPVPTIQTVAQSQIATLPVVAAATMSSDDIVLPPGYHPTEDEPFMNDRQVLYFKRKLLAWREEILRDGRDTLASLHEDTSQHADLTDRASSETDRAIELRARDRQRKLISKIDAALERIDDGSYGYCEETGDPISLKRLEARPIATLSVEAQERHEKRERVYRDDRLD